MTARGQAITQARVPFSFRRAPTGEAPPARCAIVAAPRAVLAERARLRASHRDV